MSNAKIAVVGAGLMGHGIAQVFALAGHDVTITDSFAQNLDTAKSRSDLREAVRDADYVVEAVLEDLPLKQKLFAEIEHNVRPDTILASNTSVIPITAIMQGAQVRSHIVPRHLASVSAEHVGDRDHPALWRAWTPSTLVAMNLPWQPSAR